MILETWTTIVHSQTVVIWELSLIKLIKAQKTKTESGLKKTNTNPKLWTIDQKKAEMESFDGQTFFVAY